MGEPRFDKSKRYINKYGKKIGKGVWYNEDGTMIKPGWGVPNSSKKTVTQYNTNGTITTLTQKQWHDKKTKEHEYEVLRNDRKYAIPFVPSKKMTITIDKNSPTRKNAGAVISENLLDSIAVNASKARLPFSTALGIAAQESTLGNNPKRVVGKSMLPWLYVLNNSQGQLKNAATSIPYNNMQSPSLLISNWNIINENPFAAYHYDSQGNLRKENRGVDYYENDFTPSVRKDNRYKMRDVSPLFQGFRTYKKDPYSYNHNDKNYPNKVEAQKNELVNYSPEIRDYMKKHNLKAEGGSMVNDYSYIDADNRRSNVLLHNDNGLLVDSLGNNYTQSYLDESNVPVVTGRMPRNTSPYFDPFGALTFANAASAPFTSFSPSNIVGSIREARDFPTFMDSFMNQDNGGFFTDEYASEHPYISTLGNLAGDMALGAAGDKALDVLRNLPNVPAYRKLGYKVNKLQKQLGLVNREFNPDKSFKHMYYDSIYGESYPSNAFDTAFEKNPSKYGTYENFYSDKEIKRIHNYFKENGFKTPPIYKEGNSYHIITPKRREYKLFSDNPEYYQFINETGLPPLEQSTVDRFLDRQMTSLRGVYANNERDARKFLTETEYGKVRSGGDRLGTKGGLYTSNSQGIAEAFKNPNSKQTVDGYIGRLKMKDDIDRTLPIEQQLSQMRNKVFMTNDSKIGDWELDRRMREQALDNGAVAFESIYGRRDGTTLPVTERAYLPTTDNNGINHPVTIEKLDYYPNQENKAGRWNTAGVDHVLEDNELFIPKQLNSTTDYIKYMREMLRKTWIPDELAMSEYEKYAYNTANKRTAKYRVLRDAARDAYLNTQKNLDMAKKVGAGLTLTSPLPVAAYMLKENKDLNQSINDSFNIINDYYFNGNKTNNTEDRVQQSLAFLKDNDPESYNYLMKRINKKNNSKAFGGSLNNDWDSLSYRDKAEMMRVAIANGITSLPEIKSAYNEYAKGGKMNDWTIEDEAKYRYWRSKLPKNLRDTNDNDYDMRAAYKAGMQPMWNDADKSYHLGSRDPKTGRILKSPHHPTFLKALATDASLGYYPTMDKNGNVYTETWKGNTYASGGYIPSDSIKKRITNWEGSSMKTNRSFEAEARDFNKVIPTDVRDKLSSQQLDALYSYGYNVGMGKLKERVLPTLTAYTQGKATKEDVQKSMWAAKDSQLRGLTKRRNAEREMFGGNYRTTYDGKNIGVHIDPSSLELPQTFFENINTGIPQMQSPMIEVDPSTIYKAPTIDETLFSSPKPAVDTPVFNPKQDSIEGIQRLNTIMNLMGQSSPFGFLGGDNQGIMSYVNAIYS